MKESNHITTMDEFSRYAVRVSVAQICQAVGWTKIQSTPLEVLTDFMEEYIRTIGRLANNYATLLGHSEPNLTHVSLAFKDMNISFSELQDYITHFESGAALDVPKYPIHKESHLNHLKPGSREVLTRPVHIHDHLPPMFPDLEGQVSLLYRSPTYDNLPSDRLSPIPELKIKSEPSESFYDEWNENPQGEDIRPLRELSSVLMTTSGFLSSAREGKLPEVRNSAPALPENEESKTLLEPGKTKDKENRFKEEPGTEKVNVSSDKKSKHKKHKKKKLHRDHPVSKHSHKISEEIFFNNPKQTSSQNIKKEMKKEHNISTLKKGKKLAIKLHSQTKLPSNILSDPSNLSHKDLKEKCQLKHHSLGDAKDNNLSLIDLFSVPQINGNEKPKCNDSDNIIDVVNSSPINSFDYSNHSSPLLELDDPNFLPQGPSFIPQGNISSPFFDFDRKSPELESEGNNFEVKTEHRGSEINVEYTSPNFKCDNASPSYKEEQPSPSFKPEFVSPKVKLHSPTFDFERNGSIFDSKRLSPEVKIQETVLDPNIDRSVSDILSHDLNPLFNQSSLHSKKKRKKDKKNKSKDKNEGFDDGVAAIKLKVKKKKKSSKKEKNIGISLIENPLGLETPEKKMKMEMNSSNIQDGAKEKLSASNNDQDPVPEIHSIPKISESSFSIPASHSSISSSHSSGIVGLSLAPASHPTDPVSTSHPSNTVSHDPAASCQTSMTLISQSSAITNLNPNRKSKNEERKKEKKEKRREKERMKHLSEDLFTFEPLKRVKEKEKRKSASPLPKITFKLGPSPPKVTQEPKHQKIIIKPVINNEKHSVDFSSKHHPQSLNSNSISHHTRDFLQPATQTATYERNSVGYGAPPVQQPAAVYDPNQIWICPACNRPDDGSPMIACDKCDLWFHWVCVGIFEAIEGDWYCKTCIVKKEHEKIREKKKKQKKKKM